MFTADPGVFIVRPGPHPANAPFNRLVGSATWPRWPHGIYIGRASHVTIEGFVIRGMPEPERDAQERLLHRGGAGIFVHVSDHVTLRKNHANDNGRWGIFTSFADDVVIEENECSRSREHGIYVSNSADRPVVRRNHCWGNTRAGIQINADIHIDAPEYRARGGVVDGIISGAVVEDNVLHDSSREPRAAARATGSTGNHVLDNILLNLNPEAGSIRIDLGSLLKGALAGEPFVSDGNLVVDRMAVGDAVMTLAQWQAGTNLDVRSRLRLVRR